MAGQENEKTVTGERTGNTSPAHPPPTPFLAPLRRVASALASPFISTTDAKKPKPAQPSHWNDASHLPALLKVWDAVKKEGKTKDEKVAMDETEKRFLPEYGELGYGDVVMGREWVEYVLKEGGKGLSGGKGKGMSRTEMLAVGAGDRMNWGPY
ncbi:uncharacterized protein LTR77_009026 [Saxophila tyrrhenica]|uniref:Uncharacterized protein n=1 Tax=Saxophila tyrrhenica TaxID=1690608 RepID=A0AAV9P3H5_9PEZI|nr:hypothetical protein LTR77_009026 [Saxophila tyrrhenica]